MIDPDTGEEITYGEHLRRKGVQVAGELTRPRVHIDRDRDVKKVEILREDSGRTGGVNTHHGSGRVDCEVHPIPAGLSAGVTS